MSDDGRHRDGEPGTDLVPRRAAPGAPASPTAGDLLRAAPGLARFAAAAGLRASRAAAGAYVDVASRTVRAVAQGEPPARAASEAAAELRAYARRLLDVAEEDEDRAAAEAASTDALRRRGAELLRRSAEVGPEPATHPAYMRMLESLAPDEARVLRFLAEAGPQPAVDVRAGLPLATVLIAPGCNMIGTEAGCRHPARVHTYLDNLHRLGLVWFSREPVGDPSRYQVLEAQPVVGEARERGGRTARTVRRSIQLTSFGEDFCALCLPPAA